MSEVKYKPYVWLDTSEDSSIVKTRIFFDARDGIEGTPEIILEDDVLFIIYRVVVGGDPLLELAATQFLSDIPDYDPDIHTKVTVLLKDADENILGFHTIKPGVGIFEITGSAPGFTPYIWLDSRETDNAIVHIAAWLPSRCSVEEYDLDDDHEAYLRTVTFKITETDDSDFKFTFLEHHLNAETGYDPALDTIIVNLTEFESPRVERKRGTGTTHGSEGDASGVG